MSEKENNYDKMPEYIEAIFNIFKSIYQKSLQQKDNKLKLIALSICNYIKFMEKKHVVSLNVLHLFSFKTPILLGKKIKKM